MHLRQPGSKCIASGPFTKNKERVEKVKETGDSRCIYQNELDKTCFHYEIAQEDFKDLPRRTGSDKELRDNTFNVAKNPKYDEYQRGFASINFLIKNLLVLPLHMQINLLLKVELQQINNQLKNYTYQSL